MSGKPFPDVQGGYPFPALELEVLAEWRRGRVFEKTLERSAGRPEYVFYEGPPTANNAPHVGHVVTRVVKDLFPRYRTMRGYHVARKAGWDTHGLPVEIEVEKRLGFSGKRQIESYGIAAFNRACLESVHTYEKQWRAMTERVGYWVDLDDAYYTYSNRYVESVWWALKELHRQGLLHEGHKIQPYCARCGTALSSHEVAQNYKDADDPSVWVLFPVRPGQPLTTLSGDTWPTPTGLSLVAWTTTPWTTLAHVGLAVHPDAIYRVVAHPARSGATLVFAEGLEAPVPCEVEGEGKRERLDLRTLPAIARVRGRDLVGLRYARPFQTGPVEATPAESAPFEPPPSDAAGWCVFPAEYVTTADGTGIVHTAPPFGEDDYQSGRRYGLPFLGTVDEEGRVRRLSGIEPFAGLLFKDADAPILRDLRGRGLLLHAERTRHSYPFCWRCDQPLLYFATRSWFVRTTEPARKAALVRHNREGVHWHPAHVGEGRFGNWLENVVDWALSRSRYWGTPLPIWRCDGCRELRVVGSYAELFEAAGRPLPEDVHDPTQFDPHRPAIDAFSWPCGRCGGALRRVEEVIDAWFDSGSMPFAQHHYPFENQELFRHRFPADFICEAVDQTRGWFYTLHVLGTLLFDSPAYRNCIVLGHVNDERGRKMSKRLGNVVDPMTVIEESGADALRWYFYASNPELTSRFSARLVREAAQGFLLPLWNALSFFTIYANLDDWHPEGRGPEFAKRPALDRWILVRLDRLVAETTERLDAYQIAEAARGFEAFIDELTNWYIRRSRSRFWASRADAEAADKESAYATLHEVLLTVAKLLAPMTPFVAERIHANLARSQGLDAPESVHLEAWPAPEGRREERLEAGMGAVQRIVRLAHAARNEHGLRVRQPLPAVTLVTADEGLRPLVEAHREILLDELNVKEIRWASDRAAYVHFDVRPVFPKCGPRFGRRMPEVKRALAAADGDALAQELARRGRIAIELAEGPVELSADEVELRLVEREGLATHADGGLLVVLDTELTPELASEGLAREVIHRIQTARKEAALDYADRIRVRYRAAPELGRAIDAFAEWIRRETLALELRSADGEAPEELSDAAVEQHEFAFGIEKAS